MAFNFFKSKKQQIFQPVKGTVIPLSEVADEVFASGMMGPGFAIKPTDGKIVAPVSGEVLSVFPTKHALTLVGANQLEILIHIGIDTVELNGLGFSIPVVAGQKVKAQELLAEVDFAVLEAAGKPTEVMVLFPNLAPEKAVFDFSNQKDIVAEL